MSLFGRIFGGKRQFKEDEERRAFELQKAKDRQTDREHEHDDKLEAKKAQDEADKVAYANHVTPTNRTAGDLQAVGGIVGNVGNLVGNLYGGHLQSNTGGGMPPNQGGYTPQGGGSLIPGGMDGMMKNPMILIGAAIVAFILLKPKK